MGTVKLFVEIGSTCKKTSFVAIDEFMVSIDTELDFKLTEFVLQQKDYTERA
jgi:hypothetical protein